jgi:hypothetical protein
VSSASNLPELTPQRRIPKQLAPRPSATAPLNPYLSHLGYDWDASILWTRTSNPTAPPPALDDPQLHTVSLVPNPSAANATAEARPKKRLRTETGAAAGAAGAGAGGGGGSAGGVGGVGGKDRYNLSNDNFYEVSRERQRVRQTFGNLVVQHAYPAMKLQLPFVRLLPSLSIPSLLIPTLVQNPPHETRSPRIPPTRTPNSCQHRVPLHARPEPQEEKRQERQAGRQRDFEKDG